MSNNPKSFGAARQHGNKCPAHQAMIKRLSLFGLYYRGRDVVDGETGRTIIRKSTLGKLRELFLALILFIQTLRTRIKMAIPAAPAIPPRPRILGLVGR